MFGFVTKTLTASALSLTIALTGLTVTSTPAAADAEAVAGVIAGLAALYAISRAVDNRNDRDDRNNATVTRQYNTQPQRNANGNGHRPHRNTHGNGHRPHRNALIAPANCFRSVNTPHGQARGYAARCMRTSVARPNQLPENCVRQINSFQGSRYFYQARCLERNGWVLG
jgi:hypothetical protein